MWKAPVTAAARTIARDVTVVVPSMGGPVLRGCLESIANGTLWPACLVVVNQAGHMKTADWISELHERGMVVVHARMNQAGIAAATNRGLEHVRTRYVAVRSEEHTSELQSRP